jgi:hypothetical protein
MKLIMESWRKFNEEEKTVIAYHGSNVPIENFSRDLGAQGVMWFSEDKDKVLQGESGACSSKYIMKVELTTDKTAGWDEYDKLYLKQIEDEGFDSIKLDENWVMFDPRRIKVIDVEEPTCSLNEGITDVVYHKTTLHQAAEIMQSNKLMTSVAFGTPSDKDQNKGKLYFLSTMRSPAGDYGPGMPAVTFKLDGRKLSERSKAAAVDYWGPNFPKDEMEDRVFTDEPFLEPATKYITEVHVGMPVTSKDRKMRPARIEEAETIAALAESAGVPVYFYTSEKTYGILNKLRRGTLNQWKQAFKEAGGELDEPWGYKSTPYKSSLLRDVAQMIQGFESGNVDDIEKGHRSEWYNIKYDSQFGRGLSERASQLQVAVHNAKSAPHARGEINIIAQKVKKLGGLQELTNWIQQEIKKYEGEQELKQVAERHGFGE